MPQGTRLGKSRVFRIDIPVTSEHIAKKYSARLYMKSGVVYRVDQAHKDEFWAPTNPLEQAFHDVFGQHEIYAWVEGWRGRLQINGHYYTLDPPDVLFLRHWKQGSPVRPYTATIDLYEGRLPI